MFSLPNIKALSERAARARKYAETHKTLPCDECGKRFKKDAPGRYVEETFGPFNEKPEGMIVLCPKCAAKAEERHGEPYDAEAYFRCADCGNLHVTNYSWEIYLVRTDDDEELCRHCAGRRAASDDNPAWLRDAVEVEAATESIEALQAYGPKHLTVIGGHDLPSKLISFRDTAEYKAAGLDWFNRFECGGWGQLANKCAEQVRESCLEVLKHYNKCMVIVGEAGQFQAYLDIVVKDGDRRE